MKSGTLAKILSIWPADKDTTAIFIYGQTGDGRYVFAVLEHVEGSVYKPITARDMTDREQKRFRRLTK